MRGLWPGGGDEERTRRSSKVWDPGGGGGTTAVSGQKGKEGPTLVMFSLSRM